jgi:hypothetical protein
VVIVVVEEVVVGGNTLGLRVVGPVVGPFLQKGPVEPFHFPVRLGPIGASPLVFDLVAQSFCERC